MSNQDRETWIMTYRFGSGFSLIAEHAFLKDTKLSYINKKLLEQCGATEISFEKM